MAKHERHPLNAQGDFYVEYGYCTACDASPSEAPNLLNYDENMHCYFVRQPETEEEINQAVKACWVSEFCAVRYAGNNPKILEKLAISKASCDIYN